MSDCTEAALIAVRRERKVHAIAALLQRNNVDSDTAAKLDSVGRNAAAMLAGQRPPSDVTWLCVVEKLRLDELASPPRPAPKKKPKKRTHRRERQL